MKLKRDFFKRHDIRIIESMPNGKDYILFYLKLLCESVDHEGHLRFSETIPYNADMLCTITETNIDVVKSAIKVFTELGMMELLDDGTIFMCEVEKMIGSAADNDNANRQRRFKEKRRQLAIENGALPKVTECVTKSNESKSIDIDIDIDIEKEIEKKERETAKRPTDFDNIISKSTDNEALRTALYEFIKMRKLIKKPMTNRALELTISKLFKLAKDDKDRIAILNQSIVNSWQGVFELKENGGVKSFGEVKKNPALDYDQRVYDESEFSGADMGKWMEDNSDWIKNNGGD